MKKIISILLAVLMVASIVAMLPIFTVSAAENEFAGDSKNPAELNDPQNGFKLAIDKDSAKRELVSGTGNFGESSYKNLVDGNITGSKIEGGLNSSKVAVTFETENRSEVRYYVLYTGSDNKDWTGRNPDGWTLYGKNAEGVWVVLDEVANEYDGDTFVKYNTGLTNENSKGYAYTIDENKIAAYQEYKIEFFKVGDGDDGGSSYSWNGHVQFGELELYGFDEQRTETAVGYIQLRPGTEKPMDNFDARIIVEANVDYLSAFDKAVIAATFEYTENGEKKSKTAEQEITKAYMSIKAGNETFSASSNCAYFGVVVTGIPTNDYTVKANLTLYKNGEVKETKALNKDSDTGVAIANPMLKLKNPAENTTGATELDKGVYKIERLSATAGQEGDVVVTYDNAKDISAIIANGGRAVVSIDGKDYVIDTFATSEDGYWFRANVKKAGAVILPSTNYTVVLYLYDINCDMVCYTKASTKTSELNADTRDPQNITLPNGITQVTGVTAGTVEDITPWGDGPVGDLFDGNLTSTKLGGNCTAGSTFTINFTTSNATTVKYYTLVTGGDTASQSHRNPANWKLYGKVNGEWVVLSDIATPGLEAKNSTPYSYQVENPQSCTEYKIVFTSASEQFQMNELVLYTD